MRTLLFMLSLCMIASVAKGQLHLDDPAYVYKTQSGEILKDKEVSEMLHSPQHYSLQEEAKDDGTFVVTLVPITDQEFKRIIGEKKKLAKKMKGQRVPDYTVKDTKGRPVSKESFESGKVTVYNFWFASCPHCLKEIPDLNRLVKDFGDEVIFLAPTFNTHTQVADFLKNNPFNYQVLTSAKSLANDLHIRSYPSHYIVDDKGMIRNVYIGGSKQVISKIRKQVKKLLKESKRTVI
ncbi:MAG: TlpA disulfide reductase family protein [Cyclobacteriaceae bacterium]